jgi:hypothetical protein
MPRLMQDDSCALYCQTCGGEIAIFPDRPHECLRPRIVGKPASFIDLHRETVDHVCQQIAAWLRKQGSTQDEKDFADGLATDITDGEWRRDRS